MGESPKEKISAFELFSAYYEFTKDGLCNKLKKEAILDMQENSRIEKKKKKKLYVNKEEKLKECSHCGEILPFEEFSYIDDGRSKRLRHLCKNCRSLSNKKYFAVSKMKMKLYLLENLGSTCLCKKDLIEILPSVSFHHPTDKKTYTWSEGREQNEDQYIILKKLKSDGAIPLCANCHKLETASLFRKYKDLILTNNLFDKSTNNIINLIETTIKNETAIRKSHIRKHIKRWIRKRYIIEKLFEGKCQCCGNVDINNLPAFVMHHIGKHEDTSRWKDISDNDCEEIINTILKERIIFICSNCHRTIHSVFHKYVEEILEMYSEEYVEKIKKHITERYYKFKGLLDDYDYNFKESDIRSPLKVYIFSNQDSWKLYLIQFYYVMKKLQISSFRRDDFSHFFHINVRNVTNWIPVLLEMGFIKIEIPTLSQYHYYTFTQKGLKMIERIEIENKDETLREYKKIFSTNTDSIIRPLRYRVFMRVYNHPNITVGDLIRNDFINESEKSVRNYYYEARKYFPKK